MEAGEGKIFAQRMAREAVVRENAPHVVVLREVGTKEVVGLSLQSPRGRKQGLQRWNPQGFGGTHGDDEIHLEARAVEEVVDGKATGAERIVGDGDVDQLICVASLKRRHERTQGAAHTTEFNSVGSKDKSRMFPLQLTTEGMLGGKDHDWLVFIGHSIRLVGAIFVSVPQGRRGRRRYGEEGDSACRADGKRPIYVDVLFAFLSNRIRHTKKDVIFIRIHGV